jgi:enoyl-CoA hydratase
MGEFVNIERPGDAIATIRLDRPKVNALNRQVSAEIGAAVDELRQDESTRAVIVYGGEKVFAAGADIKEMNELDPVAIYRYISLFQDVFSRLEQLPQITIAAINGYALGGGCELALACDFRICSPTSQLGQPEILLGVIPGAGGTQRLPRLVGVGRAKDIIYSGRFVAADEALAIGMVTEIAQGDVFERAVEVAKRYAAGPSVALLTAKQAIQNGIEVDMANGLLIERQGFAALFASEDQKIGMKSFVEHGPGKAKFVGR